RITRKNPMLVLPGLQAVLVQQTPNRTPTHRFAQGLLDSARQVRQRLTAERQAGLGHGFTRQGTHQSMVQRGKKRACGHVPGDRRWRNLPLPSGDASVVLDARTTPSAELPLHGPSRAALATAAPSGSVGPLGRWRCVAERNRVPLAKTPRGKYKEWVWDHAYAASLLVQTCLPRSPPIPNPYENHDVICETDH